QPNDNLCLRRLPGDQFLGNPIERHTQGVAQIADCAKTSFSPPCERLPSLGQTEQALLARQFEALRDGDRFFYENADPRGLIEQLDNTTLAQIIERNTTLTNLQPDVFFFFSNIQGTVTTGQAGNVHMSPGGKQPGQAPSPLAGVTVELIQDGQVVETTTTDARGVYQFNGVGVGEFTVEVVPPTSIAGSSSSTPSLTIDITRGQSGPADPAIANFTLAGGKPSRGSTM
ncbi:MAG TPA: peroxidase family protein, partial [Pirellulales bacterium]|nr:peroxidase family protein [Pirellulales bacterium]